MLFAGGMIQYFTCPLCSELLPEEGREGFAPFLDAQSIFLLEFLQLCIISSFPCAPALLVPPTPWVSAGMAQGGQGHYSLT